MKLEVIVLALVAAACAVPHHYPRDVQIRRYYNDNAGLNSYRFGFEQSYGTKREERGTTNQALDVQGWYAWRGPDGYCYIYIDDEDGFQPQIQQGPGGGGVPPAVVASLLG